MEERGVAAKDCPEAEVGDCQRIWGPVVPNVVASLGVGLDGDTSPAVVGPNAKAYGPDREAGEGLTPSAASPSVPALDGRVGGVNAAASAARRCGKPCPTADGARTPIRARNLVRRRSRSGGERS